MTIPPGPPPPGEYSSGPAQSMPGPTPEERNWAMAAHAGSLLAAWIAMGFICPLIIMLVKGEESAFIRRQAVESLNFQISLLIYLLISLLLFLVLIGFVLVVVVGVFGLVMIILATVAASDGKDFRYPMTIRMVS